MFFPHRKRSPASKDKPKAPAPASIDFSRSGRIRQPDQIADKKNGYTLLIAAIIKDDMVAAQKLLQSLANPNKTDKEGKTPLHHAAAQGNPRMIRLLCEHGAQINARDKSLKTPLFHAVETGANLRALKELFHQGANADIPDKDKRLPLHHAAATSPVSVIKQLLKKTTHPNATDNRGWQPIHAACNSNSLNAVEALLFERVSLLSANGVGNTCLHLAAARKEGFKIAKHILKTSAAQLVNAVNLDNETPLHTAVACENEALVPLLLAKGALPNAAGVRGGDTPLSTAVSVNNIRLARMLLAAGSDPGRSGSDAQRPPLLKAAQEGSLEMVQLLIEAGADLNCTRNENRTPLMAAVERGHNAITQALIEAGADLSVKDTKGRNILHLARFGLEEKVLQTLIKSGADINAPDHHQNTPLTEALRSRNLPLARLLLKAGAHPNTPSADGEACLILAMTATIPADKELIDLLLAKGADPNAQDPFSKMSALHIATQQGFETQVEQLLAAGAKPNQTDRHGRTPLHYALQRGRTSMPLIQKLLDKKADPTLKDTFGHTPYDMAQNMRRAEVTEMFRRHLAKEGRHYNPSRPKPPDFPGMW